MLHVGNIFTIKSLGVEKMPHNLLVVVQEQLAYKMES